MKAFIIGQKWFGAEALKLCVGMGYEVTGVCAPEGRDRLRSEADRLGVPVARNFGRRYLTCEYMPEDLGLIVAAHAHTYISADTRRRARLGAIGYHPSLLPLHRGRDAVRWAIRMGDRITGGTVYLLSDTADGGPVIAQDWCFIRPGQSPQDLWRRSLAPLGLALLARALASPEKLIASARPQDDSLATWEPAIGVTPLVQSRSV